MKIFVVIVSRWIMDCRSVLGHLCDCIWSDGVVFRRWIRFHSHLWGRFSILHRWSNLQREAYSLAIYVRSGRIGKANSEWIYSTASTHIFFMTNRNVDSFKCLILGICLSNILFAIRTSKYSANTTFFASICWLLHMRGSLWFLENDASEMAPHTSSMIISSRLLFEESESIDFCQKIPSYISFLWKTISSNRGSQTEK